MGAVRTERFWRLVDRQPDSCWVWTGSVGKNGKPRFSDGEWRYAYRYAYESLHGPIGPGLELGRLCSTPLCVNPDHFLLGEPLLARTASCGTVEERFWAKTKPIGATGCLEWAGKVNEHGYGRFWLPTRPRRAVFAHRHAWELRCGEIPDGLHVLHRCDNPRCVLADADDVKSHLYLGTPRDNAQDRIRHGRPHGSVSMPERSPRGARHGSKTKPWAVVKGEQHGRAELNAGEVTEIRAKYAQGERTQVSLAREYGISQPHTSAIIRRCAWRHI